MGSPEELKIKWDTINEQKHDALAKHLNPRKYGELEEPKESDLTDAEIDKIITDDPPAYAAYDTQEEKREAYRKHHKKIEIKKKQEKEQQKENFQKLDEKVEQTQRAHEITEKCQNIYKAGKFIQFCKENFQKIWLGDAHVLQAVLYIGATFHLDNADEPIHLHVAGTTQSGKSDSVKTSLKFIHPDNQLTATFSPMWIFYADTSIHENLILFSDDTMLNKVVAPIFRNILTSWHVGVKRGIVGKDGRAHTLEVARHVSLILTSIENVVEESAEGQDESRYLTMEIRRSNDDERRIREFIQQDKEDITTALEIIRGIWEIIPTRKITLHKKFEMEIPNRDFKRFLTLVKCHAILCGRDKTSDEDVYAIEQFLTYSKPMVDSQTAAYTREEKSIITLLNDGKERTVNKIADETKLPYQKVVRSLHGISGTFQKPAGGLLEKLKTARVRYDVDAHEHLVWIKPT